MEVRTYSLDHASFAELAHELLSAGASIRFRARGASMSPCIEDDNVVTVAPLAETPRVGDVVLARQDSHRLLLHRVVSSTGEGVVTRGDSCGARDGAIRRVDVLGKVVAVFGPGRGLHLRFPFKYLPLIRPAAAKTLGWIPGMRWLGRKIMRMLA